MKHRLLTILFLTIALISCKDDNPPAAAPTPPDQSKYTEKMSSITDTELPAQTTVNQKLTFIVNHAVHNGCGQYARHETVVTGKDIYVTFYAKYPVEGACTQNVPIRSTPYEFTPTEIGDYVFHFKKGDNAYLLGTITVN